MTTEDAIPRPRLDAFTEDQVARLRETWTAARETGDFTEAERTVTLLAAEGMGDIDFVRALGLLQLSMAAHAAGEHAEARAWSDLMMQVCGRPAVKQVLAGLRISAAFKSGWLPAKVYDVVVDELRQVAPDGALLALIENGVERREGETWEQHLQAEPRRGRAVVSAETGQWTVTIHAYADRPSELGPVLVPPMSFVWVGRSLPSDDFLASRLPGDWEAVGPSTPGHRCVILPVVEATPVEAAAGER
jgi:hypothetical protein